MDCSGFVSMAWALPTSMVTSTLPQVAAVTNGNISGDTNLDPGDALDYTADHVVFFDHWTDSSGDFAYDAEHQPGQVTNQSTDSIYSSSLEGYPISYFEALRYNNIVNDLGNHLYGLAPDKSTVSVWNGTGTGPGAWTVIGGPATNIYAGGAGLFARNPNDGSVNEYLGTPGSWAKVGGPGSTYAVGSSSLYGLASDKSAVSVWDGGTSWTAVGGPASEIAAGN
jgi:hypothetical protein